MYINDSERWMFDSMESIKEMSWPELSKVIEFISDEVDEYCNTRFEPTADNYTIDLQDKFYTRCRPLIKVGELLLNGEKLQEGHDYFVYHETNRIEMAALDSSDYRKALKICYIFGYTSIPATVKQVIVELIKLDMDAKLVKSGGIQSENWDSEYSYTMHSSKDMTFTELRKNILSRLDIFKIEPYTEVKNTRVVKARLL